jgi:hypothetical protein
VATNFPSSLDTLNNPQSTDSLEGHAQQHTNANDAIEALQAKVGANNSAVTTSLDYRIAQLESGGNVGTELGLTGNNDLTITGIENKTTIDSFSRSTYRTVTYSLLISRGAEYYSSTILVLADGTDINISESNLISNTSNTLANVTFEENSGIISLCVTPVSSAVTARYYRTSLKA